MNSNETSPDKELTINNKESIVLHCEEGLVLISGGKIWLGKPDGYWIKANLDRAERNTPEN